VVLSQERHFIRYFSSAHGVVASLRCNDNPKLPLVSQRTFLFALAPLTSSSSLRGFSSRENFSFETATRLPPLRCLPAARRLLQIRFRLANLFGSWAGWVRFPSKSTNYTFTQLLGVRSAMMNRTHVLFRFTFNNSSYEIHLVAYKHEEIIFPGSFF